MVVLETPCPFIAEGLGIGVGIKFAKQLSHVKKPGNPAEFTKIFWINYPLFFDENFFYNSWKTYEKLNLTLSRRLDSFSSEEVC